MLQAIVAILLVLILSKLLSIKFSAVNTVADDITLVSYLLVMGLGVFLILTTLSKQWRIKRQQAHDHNHHAEHNHVVRQDHSCCDGKHVHTSDPKESWWQSLGVIFSMGIRPCAGAILVLIYVHLVGVFYYGIAATLVMGLGTGLAIASMALGTQLARNWFEKMAVSQKQSFLNINIGAWLRMAGGIVIFLLGLSLFQAAIHISGSHPLL